MEREYAVGLDRPLMPDQVRAARARDARGGGGKPGRTPAARRTRDPAAWSAGRRTTHPADQLTWYRVILTQGWKRQVRRMFAEVGSTVGAPGPGPHRVGRCGGMRRRRGARRCPAGRARPARPPFAAPRRSTAQRGLIVGHRRPGVERQVHGRRRRRGAPRLPLLRHRRALSRSRLAGRGSGRRPRRLRGLVEPRRPAGAGRRRRRQIRPDARRRARRDRLAPHGRRRSRRQRGVSARGGPRRASARPAGHRPRRAG